MYTYPHFNFNGLFPSTLQDGKTPLQVADGDDVIEYLQAGYNPENDDRLTHSDVGSVGLSSWMETSSQGTVDPMGFEVHGSFTFAEHEYLDRASSCASLYSMDSGESTPRDSPSKAKACMLGSAIGDALGATLEGCPNRDPYRPVVTDIVGGGSFHLVPGQWTDDTSMMLCLAQSLAHRKGMNLRDQLRRYWRWCSKGENSSTGKAFSVGATTLKALKKFAHSGSNSGHCGSKAPNTAGNGSLMRIAPIPVVANSLERAMEWGAEQSKTTHGTREAVEACSAFSGMVHRALAGEDKENILNCPEILNGRWSPKIKKVIEGSYREREPPDIKGTRYVVNTLEAVLWAFYKSETFTDGMILVVNLGNDADTTGAIYGALAGAYYDLEAIPKHWRDIVYWSDHIQSVAERLYKLRSRVK